MRRSLLGLLAVFTLLAAACGGDDEGAATTTTDLDTTSTTEDRSTTTTSAGDADEFVECESPEGFTVSYPGDWETNDGSVVPECTMFDPAAFDVPEGTDARPAAISIFVEDVDYAVAAEPADDEAARAVTTVDGRRAVRTVAPGGELHEGQTAVRYFVDLSSGTDDGEGTLIADTLLDDAGDETTEPVRVLDLMVRTIDLRIGADPDADVVARYEGGGAPFTAVVETRGSDPCLALPAEGDSAIDCFTAPGADDLRFAAYRTGGIDAVGGVAGDDVFRVELVRDDGDLSFLPVDADPIDGRAWALPVTLDSVSRINWYDIVGDPLGTRALDEESGLEGIGSFDAVPQSTDDFPASGEPSFLTDVRVAAHDGFDRIVFEFDGDAFSWQLEQQEEIRATSGDPVDVSGNVSYELTMTPATGVDLSGDEAEETHQGQERFSPSDTHAVVEIAEAEDFENTLRWAIGLDDDRDVAVTFLDDPTRLVLDVETG